MSIDRAIRAERLLNDEDLKQAFSDVKKAIHDQWEKAPLRDEQGAHELKLMLKLLSDVRANLVRAVADGKLEAVEQEQKKHGVISFLGDMANGRSRSR